MKYNYFKIYFQYNRLAEDISRLIEVTLIIHIDA